MMHNSEIYFEIFFFKWKAGAGTFVSCFSALAGRMTSDRETEGQNQMKGGS